jgi:type I restriction enzyme, S subunit
MYRFRVNEQLLEPRFMEAYLRAPETQRLIDAMKTGISDSGLNLTHDRFKLLPVPVAPRAMQDRIADRIDELFTDLSAGVAALERVRKKLKRYRSAVLHAAVTGRLTAEWRKTHGPCAEPGYKLLARILIDRRKQWEARTLAKYQKDGRTPPKNWQAKYTEPAKPKTDDLPELPKGWAWASVDQLITEGLSNGISVKGGDAPPGVPALKLNAMTEHGFDYDAIRYLPIDDETYEENAVRENDFYVSRGNGSLRLLARGTVAQRPPFPVVFPDTMIRIRLSSEACWIPTIWAATIVRSQIERAAKTTAGIHKVSQSDIELIRLPLPPLTEQSAIVEAVNEKLSQIDAMEAEVERGLARASRLRQAILKSAFEGKLVPQDPTDEPASVLLERIKQERASQAGNQAKRSKRPTKVGK